MAYKIRRLEEQGLIYETMPKVIPYYAEFRGVDNEIRKGEVIITEDRLKLLADKLMHLQEFAYDTETNTLRVQHPGEMKGVGISICWGEHDTYYIPIYHKFDPYTLSIDKVVKYLRPCFKRKDVRIIGQNLKYDLHVVANMDMEIETIDVFDTMVARWITDENEEKGLKEMTSVIYDIPQTHFDECLETVTKFERKKLGLGTKKYIPFEYVRLKYGAPYALADAYWTWRHYVDWQLEMLEKEDMETIFRKGSMPFLLTLYKMERRGARVDLDKLNIMAEQAKKDLDDLEYKIVELAGVYPFEVSSPQQVAELLFGYKKFNKQNEYSGNKHLVDASFNFKAVDFTKTGIPQTGDDQLKDVLKRYANTKDARKKEGLELIVHLRKHKRLSKLNNAFITGLIEQAYSDGKVHPTFNQCGTDSGRISCSSPNLQQLPRPIEMSDPVEFKDWYKEQYEEEPSKAMLDSWAKVKKALVIYKDYPTGEVNREICSIRVEGIEEYTKYLKDWYKKNEDNVYWKYYEIRSCFIADSDDDYLIALDFSNLEMRLLTHYSEDPYLIDTFVHDHDSHGATAVNMFALDCEPDQAKKKYKPLRQIAKTINFLLMYGGSATTLYNTLSKEDAVDENGDPITKEKAQEYYDKYFEAYSGVANFIRDQKKFAHKHNCVYSILGRKRRLHNINSRDFGLVSYEERLSVNSAIQGSGGDIMMMCQPKIEADKRLAELGCTQRLQVHDELVFNCPKKNVEEAIKIIKSYMEHPLPKELKIPLRVDADAGRTYADAK